MENLFYLDNPMPSVAEVEDPPETLHMAWGLWLHHRDALHRIEQRHEVNHVLRNARAADDILHYLDYVPKIGHEEHKTGHNEPSFEYDYLHEDAIYNAEAKDDEGEEIETSDDFKLGEGLEQEFKLDDKNEEAEGNELENLFDETPSKSFDIGLKKNLTEILRATELKDLGF